MEKGERIKILVKIGDNKTFFYRGIVLDENETHIVIDDIKEGEISIKKSEIVTLSKIGDTHD